MVGLDLPTWVWGYGWLLWLRRREWVLGVAVVEDA